MNYSIFKHFGIDHFYVQNHVLKSEPLDMRVTISAVTLNWPAPKRFTIFSLIVSH